MVQVSCLNLVENIDKYVIKACELEANQEKQAKLKEVDPDYEKMFREVLQIAVIQNYKLSELEKGK